MNTDFITYLIAAAISLTPIAAQSEFLPHRKISSDEADIFINSIPKMELFKYADEHVGNNLPNGTTDTLQLYRFATAQSHAWTYQSNNTYYTIVQKFRSDTTPSPSCDISQKDKECVRAIIEFEQCHLVVFNSEKRFAAAQPISIQQPKHMIGKPKCYGVIAIASAKPINDALIFILGYHDSRGFCSSAPNLADGHRQFSYCQESYAQDAPIDVLAKSAFLIRISKDEAGNLHLAQDDKCMPPLNPYDTVAKARRALKENGCR